MPESDWRITEGFGGSQDWQTVWQAVAKVGLECRGAEELRRRAGREEKEPAGDVDIIPDGSKSPAL